MRDKEAIENERKNLSRNQEKQGKIVERLVETERNLSQQVVSGFATRRRNSRGEPACR
jgi:hypothetical protein